MPQLINGGIPFTAGNTWVMIVTLKRAGVAVDVTGATLTASAKRQDRDSPTMANHAVVLTTPASGIVTLTVIPAESTLLDPGVWLADFKVVYADASVEHFAGNDGQPFRFNVRAPVTV
jgi:hypothetical protein